ncbi:MAG: uracil-DNA glycosylase [Segniliparus sp.]|uniref:uracil-DNA glycosylase n=1 Tax=Segniliparus sp. TaxID=2804064 RepID=UPI003F3B3F9D
MSARPLSELLDPGWAKALAPVEGQIHAMGDFLRAELQAGRSYLPEGKNVLRAFTYPFDEVKVLIVGQDPYPTPGHAIGLSFAVDEHVKPLPKSLQNIFQELVADLGVPQPKNGSLIRWAEHGVLMLNRVLTVRPGEPASHRGKGWEAVTEQAIRALGEREAPLVAVLWGKDAGTAKPFLPGVPVIESVHPSPLSAHRGFFGSRPFSRANQHLVELGGEPVDWAL